MRPSDSDLLRKAVRLLSLTVAGGVMVSALIGLELLKHRTGLTFSAPPPHVAPMAPRPLSPSALAADAPDTTLPAGAAGRQLRYGRELVRNTAAWLGPGGRVGHFTNGMNCQNCHLDAGQRAFGGSFRAVAATYPRFSARSGQSQDIANRVSECMARSLNGRPTPPTSPETQALVAYIRWVGTGVPKGSKPPGARIPELPYLARAADPVAGRGIFAARCQSCHGPHGAGQRLADGSGYRYPPLWGPDSYNDAAGLYRLASFAKYVKHTMPYGVVAGRPLLSDADAWDVAAFVNSQPRPHKAVPLDWPTIADKPVDHPFGPFADSFPARQHKYGPFGPLVAARAGTPPPAAASLKTVN